jgi:lysophospholipase L1-like esterase
MKTFLRTWIALLCVFLAPLRSYACPFVSGLPDFNCDGEIVISVVGDSLVYGTDDSENDGKGGYVLRTQQALPDVTIHNFGYPGITTIGLALRINRNFGRNNLNRLTSALVQSDLIVIDVGRNDEWSKTPTETATALKRLREDIEDEISRETGNKPLVVTSVLMVTRKLKKASWINELNKYIVASHSRSAPADVRFDAVPYHLCGPDRIHPTSKGYERLAGIFMRYITQSYPKHVENLRKDRDEDGLYDIFERAQFGTDPLNPDTDADGVIDGVDPDPLNP